MREGFQRALVAPLALAIGLAAAGAAAAQTHPRPTRAAAPAMPAPVAAPSESAPAPISGAITLADLGMSEGLQFGELEGRRDVFVPVPQTGGVAFTAFVLIFDDVSAHDARRSLQIAVDGEVMAALPLDGHGKGRSVRMPLPPLAARDGFIKLTFIYSGAATEDRCVDGRSVGDSLLIRPESAIAFALPATAPLEVAGTLALMPRDVIVALPQRVISTSEMATALTAARSLAAGGRRVRFEQRTDALASLDSQNEMHRWSRGLVLVGPSADFSAIQKSETTFGGPASAGGIAATRIAGVPALLLTAADDGRAARLLGSPELSATRSMPATVVGAIGGLRLNSDMVHFDQLGLAPRPVEFTDRADISINIDTRKLPAGRRLARLLLDVLVAPDGGAGRAVVSVFVNNQLLGSAAAEGASAQLDLAIPDGLAGTNAALRVLIQRHNAAGECRYAPQAYPAQILGSSALVFERRDGAQDFADLGSLWTDGLEIWLPTDAAARPLSYMPLLSTIVSALSPTSAPITVKFAAADTAPHPDRPFIAVGNIPPLGAAPPVRFDRGRVAISGQNGRTLLDIGGFHAGAVAQLISAENRPGLWIRSLAGDGSLPQPRTLRLERGDVALIDDIGSSLALSTRRDSLLTIAYPEHVSWLTIAARYRPWIMGTLWIFGSALFLFGLTRMYRRGDKIGPG